MILTCDRRWQEKQKCYRDNRVSQSVKTLGPNGGLIVSRWYFDYKPRRFGFYCSDDLEGFPPEVFDKRAVEKGQVRFFDVAYIEVKPICDKKDRLTLAVELTDFSVYYSQGIADSIAAEMKEGKSEVVCDQGGLWKISKDKEGVIKREKLTKQWTDWVDYWAVDFNYESRKEIISAPHTAFSDERLPGVVQADGELVMFEERWTGAYIFENEWQSFRTRKNRKLDLLSASHAYEKPGRYVVAVKVIDIFGNDTMTLVPVNVS